MVIPTCGRHRRNDHDRCAGIRRRLKYTHRSKRIALTLAIFSLRPLLDTSHLRLSSPVFVWSIGKSAVDRPRTFVTLDPPHWQGGCAPVDPAGKILHARRIAIPQNMPLKKRSGSETRQRTSSVRIRPPRRSVPKRTGGFAGWSDAVVIRPPSELQAKPLRAVRRPRSSEAIAGLPAALGKTGSNLNQIARAINSGDQRRSPSMRPSLKLRSSKIISGAFSGGLIDHQRQSGSEHEILVQASLARRHQ